MNKNKTYRIIYDRHVPMVEEMIARDPKPAPALIIDKAIKDFYEFTKDHFRLEGYEFHEFDEKIPVAI